MPETTISLEVSAGMSMNREFGKKLKDCRKKITLDVLSIFLTSEPDSKASGICKRYVKSK